ncbi:MAG: HNH endonuclease [Chloroflexota bacterium]|nr:HNH endonuclease [Chloroflexota bacterium]
MEEEKANLIKSVSDLLDNEDVVGAGNLINEKYKFNPISRSNRGHTRLQLTRTFLFDGAIDRYTQKRLVYTPALRILSKRLGPDIMPYHPNWKMDACHVAYWDLAPTLDHVIPIARGGENTLNNWVCCSQITNSRKAWATLDELGEPIKPQGDLREWDGLVDWFIKYYDNHSDLASDLYFSKWYQAAKSAKKVMTQL